MNLYIREVQKTDIDILFRWRNTPENYRHYLNPNPVNAEDHQKWFNTFFKIENKKVFLIAIIGSKPAGFIRFEPESHAIFNVSIGLDNVLKGKGLGLEILKLGEDWLLQKVKRNILIKAEVLIENYASIKMFEKNKYFKVYSDSKVVKLEKNIMQLYQNEKK